LAGRSQVREARAASWSDLQDRLFEGSWQDSLQRRRSRFAFRGMPDAGGSLAIRLARLTPDAERHLLRNFRKFARANQVPGDSIWNG
jgi:hypothetical protein